MKSNVKLLIGVTAALVILIGVTVVLLVLKPADTEDDAQVSETTASVNESRLLYEKARTDIEEIAVRNESGSYKIKKYADDAWFVEEFAGLVHNTSNISSVLDQACTFTASKTAAEDESDLALYGLDAPRADVTVTFGDGTVKTVSVGVDAPSGGLTYASTGDGKVYAVKSTEVDTFLKDKFYYLSKTVYTAKTAESESDTTDYRKINSITIKRSDIDYDIVLTYDVRQDSDEIISGNSSTHIMTEPVRLDLNPDKAYNVLNNVCGLTAREVAVIAPSDETLTKMGFDDPICTVDFDIVGGNLHFVVGSEAEDGYFCMADGFDMIFLFDKETVPWVTVMPTDITMPLITSTYIYAINTLDVAVGDDDTTRFTLSGDKDDFAVSYTREKTGASENTALDADLFKNFYQYFLKAPAEEIYLTECTDPARLTVTVNSDMGTDVVEFIPSTDRMSVVRLNGRTSFRCRTVYVDRLAENLDNLLEGRDIITTW